MRRLLLVCPQCADTPRRYDLPNTELWTSKGEVGNAGLTGGVQGYFKLWKGEPKSHTLPFPTAKLEIVWTAIDFGLEKGVYKC